MKPITELQGLFTGHDVWIISAGPSSGYIDREFFKHKKVIGVNRVWRFFDGVIDYCIFKEHNHALEALAVPGLGVVVSRFHTGNNALPKWDYESFRCYVFEHENNRLQIINLDVIGSDNKLVVSYSTITSALHLAAYMGADNIVLVGHDCGFIDGQRNIPGYGAPIISESHYESFLREIEPGTVAVRERIRDIYGCRVYSLNPWLNFGLEGHKYTR